MTEITDSNGQTLGYFLTPPELDRLRATAGIRQRQSYERGRRILPDDELMADAAAVGDLCPEAEMDRYREQP